MAIHSPSCLVALTCSSMRPNVAAVIEPITSEKRLWGCDRIKDNRKTQDQFLCVACGFAANADVNAAVNISRAAVNQPIVLAPHVGAGHKLPAFAGICWLDHHTTRRVLMLFIGALVKDTYGAPMPWIARQCAI